MTSINPVKKLRGTTEENDNFTGPTGMITVDTDENTLRLHDEKTPGGHTLPNKAMIEYLISQIAPVGTVISHISPANIHGYLRLSGNDTERTHNRSDYPALFQMLVSLGWIANTSGNGSTTFVLPDFRGRFLRCVGGSAAVLGTPQGDLFREHTHTQNQHSHGFNNATGDLRFRFARANGGGGVFNNVRDESETTGWSTGGAANVRADFSLAAGGFSIHNSIPTNQNTGGNETRPMNFAIHYFIKF